MLVAFDRPLSRPSQGPARLIGVASSRHDCLWTAGIKAPTGPGARRHNLATRGKKGVAGWRNREITRVP